MPYRLILYLPWGYFYLLCRRISIHTHALMADPREKEAGDKPNKDVESGRQGISHWKMITDQGVVTDDIVNWEYDGEGTEEDPFVVEWIDNDPRNPMTFSKTKKWIMAITVANSVLVVSFCSSAFSGGMRLPLTTVPPLLHGC